MSARTGRSRALQLSLRLHAPLLTPARVRCQSAARHAGCGAAGSRRAAVALRPQRCLPGACARQPSGAQRNNALVAVTMAAAARCMTPRRLPAAAQSAADADSLWLASTLLLRRAVRRFQAVPLRAVQPACVARAKKLNQVRGWLPARCRLRCTHPGPRARYSEQRGVALRISSTRHGHGAADSAGRLRRRCATMQACNATSVRRDCVATRAHAWWQRARTKRMDDQKSALLFRLRSLLAAVHRCQDKAGRPVECRLPRGATCCTTWCVCCAGVRERAA